MPTGKQFRALAKTEEDGPLNLDIAWFGAQMGNSANGKLFGNHGRSSKQVHLKDRTNVLWNIRPTDQSLLWYVVDIDLHFSGLLLRIGPYGVVWVAWLNRCRRLAKDWENLGRTALAFLRLASIRLMTGRLCQA